MKSNIDGKRLWSKAVALVALLLALLIADAYAVYRVHIQRLGNALDFYPFWAGGREVLLHRRGPYDPEVMLQIQQAIYGRPARPDENQHGYAYPAYAPFIVWPFLPLPFPAAAALWIAAQQVLVVAAVALTIRAADWRPGLGTLAVLCLAAMTFRYSMISFVLGQTAVWVLFWLAVALWAARRRHDVAAGLALVAAAIKPQLVIPPALALLMILPGPRRRRVLGVWSGTMALLLALSVLFIGPWLADYVRQLRAYQDYSTTRFPILALAGEWLPPPGSAWLNALSIAVLLGGLIAVLWRRRGTGQVALPVALSVIVTQLVVPQTGSYNLTLLLLPAVVLLAYWNRQRYAGRAALAARVLIWADLVLIPWLLWPIVQGKAGSAWDLVLVPLVLLAAVPWQWLTRPVAKWHGRTT